MAFGPGLPADLASPPAAGLPEDGAPTPAVASGKDQDRRHGRSPSQIAWDRLKADKVAIICFFIVLFFVLVAIFAPLLVKLEGEVLNQYHSDLISAVNTYPIIGANSAHWFGVEPRTGLGLLAGYLGGRADKVIGWVIDLLLSLPLLLVVLAVVPIIQQRFTPAGEALTAEDKSSIRFIVLIAILVFFGWIGLARLIRGEVLSLREREFVQAAKVIGVPTRHILFKEILPNLVGPIIVSASIAVPAYITLEATLSYLGAGLVEPTPSWGRTVSNAQNAYARYPLFLWPPVISIALLVLALSLLGESIRDAFDPNTRR